ncbi:hypothetical protein M758_10G126300 [Ceratodon purpureus]|nr:hypothetical protein M758_10G126300 [Ceratodon purpureus]
MEPFSVREPTDPSARAPTKEPSYLDSKYLALISKYMAESLDSIESKDELRTVWTLSSQFNIPSAEFDVFPYSRLQEIYGMYFRGVGNADVNTTLSCFNQKFGGAQVLRLRMRALVGRWKELAFKARTMATYDPESRKVESEIAEIVSQVGTDVRWFERKLCQSLVLQLSCWAKARKIAKGEANVKEVWVRSEAEAEAEKEATADSDEVMRKAREERDAIFRAAEGEALWTSLQEKQEANMLYNPSASDSHMTRTRVKKEVHSKLAAVREIRRIAKFRADNVMRKAEAEADEVRRKVEVRVLYFLWRKAATVADEVLKKVELEAQELWTKEGPEAQEVWRRAKAASLMKAAEKECMQSLDETFTKLMTTEEDQGKKADEEARMYAVIVSAVALLSLIYRYLAGHIDRGGTKTYSSGSLEFRSTYVSIVLFQGSYVWIKFRDVAPRRAGYRRPVTDKLSGTIKPSDKIEARYTPPRRCGDHNHIYLGLCTTHEEADIKKKIAAFYYGRHTGRLDVDDGRYFLIPSMSREEEQSLSVAGKRAWVKDRVKMVYEEIKAFRPIDTSPVHIDEQSPGYDHSSPHAEKFAPYSEGLPDVAFDPEFQVKEYVPFSEADDADFGKFLEDILDSSEDMSDLPDAEPSEHLQDIHIQGLGIGMTLDNQCSYSESLGTEPVATSYWKGVLNFVNESSEAAVNSDDMVGTPKVHDFQAVSEFPVMSPVSTLQQHSDPAMAALPDMVTPSASKLCPGNSTSDLLALKLISLYEQQLLEKDKRIVELEREVERLRGASHWM